MTQKIFPRYPTEVRVRSTPLQPCRRHGKKRGNGNNPDEVTQDQVIAPPQPIIPPPAPPSNSPSLKESKSKSRNRSKSGHPANQNQQLHQNPPHHGQNIQNSSAFASPNQQQNNSAPQQTQLPETAIGNNGNSSTLRTFLLILKTTLCYFSAKLLGCMTSFGTVSCSWNTEFWCETEKKFKHRYFSFHSVLT